MPIFGQICVKTANFTPDLGCTAITRAAYFIPARTARRSRHHRIELFQINVGDGGILRTSPGVVHQAIEAIKAVHGMVVHRLDVGFNGDICMNEGRSIARVSPLCPDAGQQSQLWLRWRRKPRGASADPASPASYNRDLSLEWQHSKTPGAQRREGHKCRRANRDEMSE